MINNKTALQELLDWVKDEENQIGKFIEVSMITCMIKDFLSKEKQQIFDAYFAGGINRDKMLNYNDKPTLEEDYYNQTYSK